MEEGLFALKISFRGVFLSLLGSLLRQGRRVKQAPKVLLVYSSKILLRDLSNCFIT